MLEQSNESLRIAYAQYVKDCMNNQIDPDGYMAWLTRMDSLN